MFNSYSKLDYFDKNIRKAITNLKSSNCSLAYEYINLAMIGNENAPEIHNLLGILSEIRGDLILAGKHYRAAGALDPTYKPASRNLDRITSFDYKFDKETLDYGDKPENEQEILYYVEYDKSNVGHLKKRGRFYEKI